MPDWATLQSSQQPETVAQLINEINELETQISTVLSQLIKANTNWQDIIAGLSGAEKDEEQTLYHALSQKPKNLTNNDAASEQLVRVRFFREQLHQRAHQLNDQSSARTQATSPAITSQAQLAVNETDKQQPTSIFRQFPYPRLQNPDLPPLKLPQFSGNLKDWPAYRSTFQELIHNTTMPDTKKLCYLCETLSGAPSILVPNLAKRLENYKAAIKLLKDTYEHEHVIRALLHRDLQAIPPIPHENDLPQLWCTLESVLCQLTALGDDINHANIVAAIKAKLPFETLRQVCRAKRQNLQWSVSHLRQLIKETVADRLQARAMTTSITINKDFCGTSNSVATTAKPPHQKTTKPSLKKVPTNYCAFCEGRHYSDQCPVYKSTDERHTRVTQKRLCLHCLRPGHFT
ncbi:unnamed protein product [Enterobius vermicularis]|uniref:CCHC-type domain-containing protein n=1 Tax=Enterobius vermicularis TaxID=51028 RepID=A0A0N4V0C2_ENTVE|nr:unnamed protein product [Enterobius vermicularis]